MNEKRIAEIRQRCASATKTPWDTGSETSAGYVWVYAVGSPLLEPLHFLRKLIGRTGLFRVRSDAQPTWSSGESEDARQDRFWRQKQADADFIANARQDVPDLLDEVERVQALVDKLSKCWRLVDGKLVQDCPVVPGMTIWYETDTGEITSDGAFNFLCDLKAVMTAWGWQSFSRCANTREAAEALKSQEDDG